MKKKIVWERWERMDERVKSIDGVVWTPGSDIFNPCVACVSDNS
jgi:hypothetical protein